MNGISPAFLLQASEVLGDTDSGLTGSQIKDLTTTYAFDYDVDIPHASYPFDSTVPNKRTALLENLKAFESEEQYRIIKDLCDDLIRRDKNVEDVRDLKIKLLTRYSHLESNELGDELDETLIDQTRHWLEGHDAALALYNDALRKYQLGEFTRNVLDDLRLALEKLLHSALENNRSIENQISTLGGYVKQRGGSPELRNMFVKLVNYYTDYQNTYVKHDDAVIEEEVEFVFELTSSFMKYVVRISTKGN